MSFPLAIELDPLSTARGYQQNYYELSCDWNVYKTAVEYKYLKENICYALFGASLSEVCTEDKEEYVINPALDAEEKKKAEEEKEKRRLMNVKRRERKETIESLYHKIVFFGSRNEVDGELYCNTIYNVIFDVEDNKKTVFPIPIFKVRRCLDVGDHNLAIECKKPLPEKFGESYLYGYCVSYIDTEGRVYKNWTDYINNNTLPKCTMVVPMGGRYQPNPHAPSDESHTSVWLEQGPSPACSAGAKIISSLDTASSAVSIAATAVGVAAMCTPVGAAVGAAASIGAAVSGVYTASRSARKLADRYNYNQSINVTDKNARSDWLGVAGGFTGVAYSGAAANLGKAAQAGANIGKTSMAVYNTLMVGNLVINGIGIGNGAFNIYTTYNETGEYSPLEIAQLATHVLFFSHAVLNVQTAGQVIRNTQGAVLKEYEDSLRSNRHRRAFRFMKRATQAANESPMAGGAEVIRSIRMIENKDDFFAGIVRNKQVFKETGAKVSFKDGRAVINNATPIDPMEFSKLPVDARIKIAASSQSQPITESDTNRKNASSAGAVTSFSLWLNSHTQFEESFERVRGRVTIVGCMEIIKRIHEEMKNLKDGENMWEKLVDICIRMIDESKELLTSKLSLLLESLWKYVKDFSEGWAKYLRKVCEDNDIEVSIDKIAKNLIDRIYARLDVWSQFIIDSLKEGSRKRHSCEEEMKNLKDGENTWEKLSDICIRMIDESKELLTSKLSLLLESLWKYVKDFSEEWDKYLQKVCEDNDIEVSMDKIAKNLIDRIYARLDVWKQFIIDSLKEGSRKRHSCENYLVLEDLLPKRAE